MFGESFGRSGGQDIEFVGNLEYLPDSLRAATQLIVTEALPTIPERFRSVTGNDLVARLSRRNPNEIMDICSEFLI